MNTCLAIKTPAYTKDGFDNYIVQHRLDAINPNQTGTKAAPHYQLLIEAGSSQTIHLRLSRTAPNQDESRFADFDAIFCDRLAEADQFYASVIPAKIQIDKDRANVMRQALAGMLWSKQYFYYDVDKWLNEHNLSPQQRKTARNGDWFHMLPLSIVDHDFAKVQLDLMLRNDYLHPNGQLPAYEWNFGDVNPPVHAYATMQIYLMDKERNNSKGDIEFLKYAFSKWLVNFTWWVNRKDRNGNNVFEGGFLGLDNIGVFDRSSPLPTGGNLEQADGTAWMVFFSQ
jgi:hypothetical protein